MGGGWGGLRVIVGFNGFKHLVMCEILKNQERNNILIEWIMEIDNSMCGWY